MAGHKSVLILEDEDEIRLALHEFLENKGYSVLSDWNGEEALDRLRSAPECPDLISLDLMMPVMDGLQFLKEKSEDAKLRSIPVMIVSAIAGISIPPYECVKGQIDKPVDMELFLNKVREHCGS